MKPKSPPLIVVQSPKPPTVEVDWTCLAAYVRFKRTKVVRTEERLSGDCFITVDLDRGGQVVGVEVLGAAEIEIAKILERAAVQAPNVDFSRVRYVRPQSVENEAPESEMAAS